MVSKLICWLLGHKPRWRRLNGVFAECCKRCGKVYQLGDWRDLDSM